MGGVAAACQQMGMSVAGSETDLYEPMKSYLAAHGVEVFPTFDPANIQQFRPDRVVVGNAVSRGNEELEFALEKRIPLASMSEIITQKLIDRNTSVVVSGTHGKTTTTSMIAWVLDEGGVQPGYMIGGVPGNFPDSCRPVPQGRHNSPAGCFVIEGDEYDTAFFDKRSKFLHYWPEIAILNNVEFDHADIFENLEQIKRSFWLFSRLVPRSGLIIANANDMNVRAILEQAVAPVAWFGEGSEWNVQEYKSLEDGSIFSIVRGGQPFARIELAMHGLHNAQNFLVAAIVADRLGVSPVQIEAAARTYAPPKRRLELLATVGDAIIVDDFAHHPTAVAATISALRSAYPGRKVIVAFEPRSNTTTRNLLQDEIQSCFEAADAVLIGPPDRPWRYKPDELLDIAGIVSSLRRSGKEADYIRVEQTEGNPQWGEVGAACIKAWVDGPSVIAVLSNGNFGGLREVLSTM